MNPISSLILGWHVTKLTDICELVEKSKRTHFIGAGGIDAFEPSVRDKLLGEIEVRMEKLRKYPPYEITNVLVSNAQMNVRANDEIRLSAIEFLHKGPRES